MSLLEPYRRSAVASVMASATLIVLSAPAGAATYPSGGGTFAADAEGWQATDASCSIRSPGPAPPAARTTKGAATRPAR